MPGFVDVSGWSRRDIQRLGHEDDDYEEPRMTQVRSPSVFQAADVWALAAAVDRINGGYLKEDQWAVTGQDTSELARRANKRIVRECLQKNDFSIVTEEDRQAGEEYRRHFTSYTMKAIAGGLNEFQQQAYKISCIEQFTGRNMLEFAIISCLPSIARRDRVNQEVKREVYSSVQLVGNVGDTIVGDITVISTRFNQEYNKYRIQARMGESFVDFWFPADLSKDQEHRIKAKIKAQRDDKTTQLNYVKKTG